MTDTLPRLVETELTPILSMAALERMPRSEIPVQLAQMTATLGEAELLMSQFHLFTIIGNRDFALEMQAKALECSTVYRIAGTKPPAIRLLALMGPGDMADNTPLDYLIEDSDIRLDLLYVLPGQPLPASIPDHDVAIIALGESGKNRPILETMDKLLAHWPRPVLNLPDRVQRCYRDTLYQLLAAIPGVVIPPTVHVGRQKLERVARQELPASALIDGGAYPLTIRPLDFHSGEALDRIDSAEELAAYLAATDEQEFFVSFYIDYRSPDSLFHKARIALIDGRPYIGHLAISEHWIVHYQSAGMAESAEKRNEEAEFMRDFDSGFALRHRDALHAIAARLELDYAVIDCAETPDGKLLVFEIDNRGWIHALDPVDVFPYKQAPMDKLFAAFRAMLFDRKNIGQTIPPSA